MLRERWRWVIPAACLALMSCIVLYHTSSQAVVEEKRRDSLGSMCDERARMLQYQLNVSMNNLQALAVVVSTFHLSKNPSSAVNQTTFARYAERAVLEQPLTSGVAYGVRVTHADRRRFERRQGWSIKKMYSSKTKRQSPSPRPWNAEVREPAAEYAPLIFAQDTYEHVISFDLLSAADDRDNVLRARESGKGVLSAPLKLRNNSLGVGVILTYAVYRYELPPNARPQERIQAAIGYLGGIFYIEALVDKLLHQLAGKQSVKVSVYDTTYESPVSMYGSNDTVSGMCRVSSSLCHVSKLNFGDPSRKHEMHCRFIQSPPSPWMAIVKSSIGDLVIAFLIYIIHASAKQIARVEDDYQEMTVLKMQAQDADIAKSQVISLTVELEQDEIVDHMEEKLDQTERKSEEVGMRSKLITMVHWCCLNRKAVSVGLHLLGLMITVLVIGAFVLPFNQSLGIRKEDENMTLNKLGWSHHGRLLISTLHGSWAKGGVENSDMIIVGLRKMTVNNDSSGQKQQTWYSHMSSKHKSTEMQNETVKPQLPTHLSHKTTIAGLWIAVLSVIVILLGTSVCLLLWCNRRKRVQENELELSGGNGPRRFQLCELAAATSNFRDDNKLGQGGFGPVYKGYLRNQHCHVAIKVLSERQSEQGLREFKAEVKIMNQLRHRNIVKLVGWCDSENRLMLVYELMVQGSLDKHLYDSEEVLTWQQRYKILLGLGSGLLYLHRGCEKCIVHGDIKPANIMLDASYNAKLGDFGLARLVEHGEQPQTTQVVAGTPGYNDPEFLANRWPRTELDVYSFGVVLLEIACGKRPASRQPNGASSLLAWVIHLYVQGMILDAADERLNGEFDRQQMERVLVAGLWCAHRDPVQRPSVEQAMDVLRSADAELAMLRAGAVLDERPHVRSMEEQQAYGDLLVEDRTVHTVAPSTSFTSKDSAYLLAQA